MMNPIIKNSYPDAVLEAKGPRPDGAKPYRILLLSRVRPVRTWRFVNRITQEVPAAEICGIVQRPMRQLPLVEQLIARGCIFQTFRSPGALWRAMSLFCSVVRRFIHWVLWWVHGCPGNLDESSEFTADRLIQKCAQVGWPAIVTAHSSDAEVLEFIRQKDADLLVVLGEFPLGPDLLAIPSHGVIRVEQSKCQNSGVPGKESLRIRIEHFTKDSETPFVIASLTVPPEPNAGLLGLTIKIDLISNDLLIETASALRAGNTTQASIQLTEWIGRIYSPYATQLEHSAIKTIHSAPSDQPHRPVWKLCMETLLLCSPWIVLRNWYRRLRGRYPVLILAHHVVSDRPHTMGMSTETFWRQVRFLQRHYRIASLSDALELLRADQVHVPTVTLTFDDGYADNFVSLRAVAEETGISVALFITIHPVEYRRAFQHYFMNGSTDLLPLTWEQIRYWSLRGAEFGSHTRTHFDCNSADRPRLEQEIVGSKADLESHLENAVPVFAFPFGQAHNMSSEALELAGSAYAYFVSDFGGENLPGQAGSGKHLFRKGFYAHPWELELELQSVFDLGKSMKQRFHFSPKDSHYFQAEPLSLLPSRHSTTDYSAR
jgi:peptidoglycan/xylan/chitin deacetylase (PgdA/CDA1 family)